MKKRPVIDKNELYSLLLDFVRIPSVSPSMEFENKAARFIYDRLARLPYFREHPEDLRLLPLEDDPYERHFLAAMVRSRNTTGNTVLLGGHFDVVTVASCGDLAHFAFDPEEYTARLDADSLLEGAARDLGSGEWLFGRGVADMKSGLAAGIALLEGAAASAEWLYSNIMLIAVPDEEVNSTGMLSAAQHLARLQRDEGLRYLGFIELEPTFAPGDGGGPAIYLGTIGKINTFFFCAGKETHVGEYYEGFGASQVLSRINLELEGNPRYSDTFEGVIYPPFGCMRQSDLRDEYSATIMSRGFSFYGYLTSTKLPVEILEEIKDVAKRAVADSVSSLDRNATEFARSSGRETDFQRWKPTVVSFRELEETVRQKLGGEFDSLVEDTLAATASTDDTRMKAIRLVERLFEAGGLRPPLVVVGFLPPWYPHRANYNLTDAERDMVRISGEIAAEARERHGIQLEIRPFFEGVSDLSYCGFQGDAKEMEAFARNMPGWRRLYSLPTEALGELDIPILNFGPVGRDAHKNTERLHLPFYLDVYPKLLCSAVAKVSERGGL
ncbi:MAG: M20/M25/M40 family metallo-hydrolase [Synergistaceae bacterium]|nr:M20/M25/M40 family metallo-hydrolase [Synergistota bacterium]NLM70437.1 M20/M25/M40 family metallo-hydrolase [Synergistaceae bacterium]